MLHFSLTQKSKKYGNVQFNEVEMNASYEKLLPFPTNHSQLVKELESMRSLPRKLPPFLPPQKLIKFLCLYIYSLGKYINSYN